MSTMQATLFSYSPSKKHRSSGQNDHSYSRSRSRELSKSVKRTSSRRSRSPKRGHSSRRRRSSRSSDRETRRKRSHDKKERSRHRRSKSRDDHKSRRHYEKERRRRSPSEPKTLNIVKQDSKKIEDRLVKRMLVEYADLALEEGEVKDSSTNCPSPSEKETLLLLQSSREESISFEESLSISPVIIEESIGFNNYLDLEKSTNTVQDPRKRFFKSLDANQKLNLVLDLDETLIHSCNMTQFPDLVKIKGIPADQLHIMNCGSQKIAIVVRPYALDFIKRASKNYNLYVYSHGAYPYVEFILDILDKERLYIKRDRIFKNTGQVTGNTPKELANLGFSPEECSRTLILDDQKVIWKNESSKVICSKKFMPYKQFSQLQKYNKYHLFSNELNEWQRLSIEEEPYDLNYYLEKTWNFEQQLKSVSILLESIAQNYSKISSQDLETIYKKIAATVLKGKKIAVISSSITRVSLFKEVVEFLGGVLVEPWEAHYLVKDTSLGEKEKSLISKLCEGRPLLTVLPVAWLMECFFTFDLADLVRFKNLNIAEF